MLFQCQTGGFSGLVDAFLRIDVGYLQIDAGNLIQRHLIHADDALNIQFRLVQCFLQSLDLFGVLILRLLGQFGIEVCLYLVCVGIEVEERCQSAVDLLLEFRLPCRQGAALLIGRIADAIDPPLRIADNTLQQLAKVSADLLDAVADGLERVEYAGVFVADGLGFVGHLREGF